jgi:hypothetical protein
MFHPATTAELARQRRASLLTEAAHQRLARQTKQTRHEEPAIRAAARLTATTRRLARRALRLAAEAD